MEQDRDDYLMISGIQHMAFCERQWALICIEQQWIENVLTLDGKHLHERADDVEADETRGRLRSVRAMPLVSDRLRIRGIADVVEFHRASGEGEDTVLLNGRDGFWQVVPVEYKRGKSKPDDRDEVQLCAQALCLEESFGIRIHSGYLYYATLRRRDEVLFTDSLRKRVESLVERMQVLYREARTPRPVYQKHCESCSLNSVCKPRWSCEGARLASRYVNQHLSSPEEETCDDY